MQARPCLYRSLLALARELRELDSPVDPDGLGLPGHLVLDHFSVTLNRVSNLCAQGAALGILGLTAGIPANGHSPGGQCLEYVQL